MHSRHVKRLRLLWAIFCSAFSAYTPAGDLAIGDSAPEFALQGSDGKVHRLTDYRGTTVVLAWFPKAFTGG